MEDSNQHLSLREALSADMALDTGFQEQKLKIASTIINVYQAAGIDVDKPAKDFTDAEIDLINSLEPVLKKIAKAALQE